MQKQLLIVLTTLLGVSFAGNIIATKGLFTPKKKRTGSTRKETKTFKRNRFNTPKKQIIIPITPGAPKKLKVHLTPIRRLSDPTDLEIGRTLFYDSDIDETTLFSTPKKFKRKK